MDKASSKQNPQWQRTPPSSFGQQPILFYCVPDLTEITTSQAYGYDHTT